MTESEWLNCTDPTPMLGFLRGRASERQLRLFAVTCCRAVWELLADKRSRTAIRKLEEYADDLENEQLRRDAYNIANAAYLNPSRRSSIFHPPGAAACAVVCAAAREVPPHLYGNLSTALIRSKIVEDDQGVMRLESDLLRDIFGKLFYPVSADPIWLTPTVVALASGIYADRVFGRMPILADALQDAGCDNANILNHCRSEAPHVRGCWVIDLLLGKE